MNAIKKPDAPDVMVKLNGKELGLRFCHYNYASHLALRWSEGPEDRVLRLATILHLPGRKLKPNQVLVNEQGKTKGMLKALEEAGVVRATGEKVAYGKGTFPVAELLIEPPAHLKESAQRISDGLQPARDSLSDFLSGTSKVIRFPEPTTDREILIDQVGNDFFRIEQQLDPGLLVLLEAHNVPKETRKAVSEYLGDVLKGLLDVEREVSKLCNVPGATKAGYRGLEERKQEAGKARERDAGLER